MWRQRALAAADVPVGADGLEATEPAGGSAAFRCVSAAALGAFIRAEGIVFAAGAFASVALCVAVAASCFGAAGGVGSDTPAADTELFRSARPLVELLASEAGCVAGVAEIVGS